MVTGDLKKKLLDSYPVLKGLDPEQLELLFQKAEPIELKRGVSIFRELERCKGFPFILSGVLRVYKESENGREISLYQVEAGDACVVTTGCILGNELYRVSGVVKEDALVLSIGTKTFEQLLEIKQFRDFIFSLFSKRVLKLMQLLEEVAFHKLDIRLASLILNKDKPLEASHQEMADELGTVREIVTRLLNSFSDSGFIKLRRKGLDIIDEKGLKKFIEG